MTTNGKKVGALGAAILAGATFLTPQFAEGQLVKQAPKPTSNLTGPSIVHEIPVNEQEILSVSPKKAGGGFLGSVQKEGSALSRIGIHTPATQVANEGVAVNDVAGGKIDPKKVDTVKGSEAWLQKKISEYTAKKQTVLLTFLAPADADKLGERLGNKNDLVILNLDPATDTNKHFATLIGEGPARAYEGTPVVLAKAARVFTSEVMNTPGALEGNFVDKQAPAAATPPKAQP